MLISKWYPHFQHQKTLYDLQESPLACNQVLHQKLNQMKFKCSIADPCAYTRQHKVGPLYLTVHVDMLLASPSDSARLWFEKDMESQFELSKKTFQVILMAVKKSKDGISVHQRGTSTTWFRSSKSIQTPRPRHLHQQIS